MSIDQHLNMVDDVQTAADHDPETSTGKLQTLSIPNRDDFITMNSRTSSRPVTPSGQWGTLHARRDPGISQSRVTTPRDVHKSQLPQRHQARPTNTVQDTIGEDDISMEDSFVPPRRYIPGRSESSFANPTKASRAWQTEKHLSTRSPALSVASRASSIPRNTDPNISVSLAHHSSRQSLAEISRHEGYSSPLREVGRTALRPTRSYLSHFETLSETAEHDGFQLPATQADVNSLPPLTEVTEDADLLTMKDMEPSEHVVACNDPAHIGLLNTIQRLQIKLDQADQKYHQYREKVNEFRGGINSLSSAWLEVCTVLSVEAVAVAQFQALVTGSEGNLWNRAALQVELEVDIVCGQINNMHAEINNLQVKLDGKDKVTTVDEAEDDIDPLDSTVDWHSRYIKENKRFQALSKQHKRLKDEAARMYQPDLEEEHEALQAEMIATQDHIHLLTESTKKAQEEAESWRNEFTQQCTKTETFRDALEEQHQLQAATISAAAETYRVKVADSTRWDYNGFMQKLEQFERDQELQTMQLHSMERASAAKDEKIIELRTKRVQDQREIRELRGAGTVAGLRDEGDGSGVSPQDAMAELLEKQRKRREKAETEEALREKLRQLSMGDRYLPGKPEWQEIVKKHWWVRWKGDEHFEGFSEEEKELLKDVRTSGGSRRPFA